MFRTTESLALRNDFAVPVPIDWENFGLSLGTDNRRYSIFGPVESIVSVPLLKIAYFLERNDYEIDSNHIPISFHVMTNDTLAGVYFIEGKQLPAMKGQYARFLVSFLNPIVGALSAMFLYFVLIGVTKSEIISLFTTFLFSFGSIFFTYTGTFFSEPLCTMFVIISFLFIIKNESNNSPKYVCWNYFNSGLFLGLATATHISAVLSIPFYYIILLGQVTKEKFNFKNFGLSSLYFTLGLIVFGALLFYYNLARFGSVFETGRSILHVHYADYSNPLSGLYGLLLSPGKGLFIYSPIVFLSFIFWKYFHKSYPHLSLTIFAMIIIRLFFIASRSDWHGGFCLGPRYFVIIMPFLFLPIALGLKNILLAHNLKYFFLFSFFGFLCIIQQIFFALGEIFSYLHIIYINQKNLGINTLVHNSLYLNWQYSPALYLLNYKTGPFLLKFISTDNYVLWLWSGILFLAFYGILGYSTYKSFAKSSISTTKRKEQVLI